MTTQNKTVPALRFAEFNENWEEKKLKDICSRIMDGTHFSPKSTEGTRKYLTSKNIRNGGLDFTNLNYISEEEHKSIYKRCPVKFGDVLLTKDGANTGNCCINTLDEEFSLLSSVAVLSGKKDLLDNVFLLQILQSSKGINMIDNVMAGQAISRITLEKINSFKFQFPTLPEQQKIAAFLTAVDEKIQQLTKKKDLLEKYKKGVMQKIFNQEIRFKDDNGNDFADWEEKKLGEVAKFSKGKGVSKSDISEDGNLECIRYGQLYTHYKETISEIISKTNIDKSKLVLSEYNDVIIPASGETQLDIATASCVLKTGVALGGDLNIIKSKMNGVFLSYYLNNKKKLDIANLAQGVSVVHLYSSQLATLKIDVPHSEEQNKIGNFISSIDDKINLVNQQLEKTKEYKKGLLQQMFV